jgi:hypothetical protein
MAAVSPFHYSNLPLFHSGSVPAAADPNVAVATVRPMPAHPDRAVPGTRSPAATDPNPDATVPSPIARHPIVSGTGRDGDHFHLRRRRRALSYDNSSGRRCLRRHGGRSCGRRHRGWRVKGYIGCCARRGLISGLGLICVGGLTGINRRRRLRRGRRRLIGRHIFNPAFDATGGQGGDGAHRQNQQCMSFHNHSIYTRF